MLKYTDFLLIENFEKELNSFVLNEDIFHPIKTKRIKNALKKYVKAEVEVARFDTESQKRIDKVEGKEAKEKLKQALDKKKEVAQDRIAQIDDTLTANATTDSLKDLVTYGKAAAKEKALDIRAKAALTLGKGSLVRMLLLIGK